MGYKTSDTIALSYDPELLTCCVESCVAAGFQLKEMTEEKEGFLAGSLCVHYVGLRMCDLKNSFEMTVL